MPRFSVREEKGNRDRSIPPHWDILMDGDDDAIITVWQSRELTDSIVACLVAAAEDKTVSMSLEESDENKNDSSPAV